MPEPFVDKYKAFLQENGYTSDKPKTMIPLTMLIL